MTPEEVKKEVERLKGLNWLEKREEQEKVHGKDFEYKVLYPTRFYWGVQNLPSSVYGSDFRKWMTKNSFLVTYIAQRDVKIEVGWFDTAMTDGNTILLPIFVFVPEFYTLNYWLIEKTAVNVAVLLYNGFLIHEAAHIRWSFVPSAMLGGVVFNYQVGLDNFVTDPKHKTSKLLKDVFNFGEDLYIDNNGIFSWETRNIYEFVEEMTKTLLFKFENFPKAVKAFEQAPSLDTFMNMFQYVRNEKTWRSPLWPDFVRPALELIISSWEEKMTDPAERFAMYYEAYKLIIKTLQEYYDEKGLGKNVADEEEHFEEESKEKGQDGTGEGQAGSEGDLEQQIQQFYESLSDEEKEQLEKLAEKLVEEIKERQEQLQQDTGLDKKAKDNKKFKEDQHLMPVQHKVIKDHGMAIIDILRLDETTEKVEWTNDFKNFSSYLKRARTRKKDKVNPDEFGHELTEDRLDEFHFDDALLFEVKKHMKRVRGEPEIIFLIDASGSTGGSAEDGSGKCIFDRELEAAYGCSRDMISTRMRHAVYAHTSGRGTETVGATNSSGCHVYGIYSFDMPFMGQESYVTHPDGWHKKRFDRGYAISRGGNYDGLAIEAVGGMFSKRPGAKVLIVISDGAPSDAPPGYSPLEYTIEARRQLNAKGIMVISMSVTEYVVENNNEIYGEAFNIDASNGKLATQAQKLIRLIAESSRM